MLINNVTIVGSTPPQKLNATSDRNNVPFVEPLTRLRPFSVVPLILITFLITFDKNYKGCTYMENDHSHEFVVIFDRATKLIFCLPLQNHAEVYKFRPTL